MSLEMFRVTVNETIIVRMIANWEGITLKEKMNIYIILHKYIHYILYKYYIYIIFWKKKEERVKDKMEKSTEKCRYVRDGKK